MLSWPFCVGLIIGPPYLAARIRASATQNDLVLASLDKLKPLFVTRNVACLELARQNVDDGASDDSEKENTPVCRPKRKETRLDQLEKNQSEMREMLEHLVNHFQGPDVQSRNDISEYEDSVSPDSVSDIENSVTWQPPDSWEPDEEPQMDMDFEPKTQEQEPAIPAAQPNIEIQGIDCQRLGTQNYNKIRYAEVQKKFKAFPVFSALRVNPQISFNKSFSQSGDYLPKMDSSLAAISHGLLLQRDALSQAIKMLTSKHPQLKSDICQNLWGPLSKVKILSDNLLQYTCGRRSEVIELRRKSLRPRDQYVASLLEKIPPSTTHLFEENAFEDLYKQYANSFRPPLATKRSNYNQENVQKFKVVRPDVRPSTSKLSFSSRSASARAGKRAEDGRQFRRNNASTSRGKPYKNRSSDFGGKRK